MRGPTPSTSILLHWQGRCTGSVPYNAPEMFLMHSNEHDLRALDMWAVGIVIYATMLSAFPWERAAVSDRHYRAYITGEFSALDGWDRLGDGEKELVQGLVCFCRVAAWTASPYHESRLSPAYGRSVRLIR